jgi:hypothetical protein
MKRSAQITLTLLAVAAATACSRTREAQVQRCVDDKNAVAEDINCESPQRRGAPYGAYYFPHRYRWVYGGNGGYIPGSIVSGYAESPTQGVETVRGSALAARGYNAGGGRVGVSSGGGFTAPPSAHGGFGATGEGHASGGGT